MRNKIRKYLPKISIMCRNGFNLLKTFFSLVKLSNQLPIPNPNPKKKFRPANFIDKVTQWRFLAASYFSFIWAGGERVIFRHELVVVVFSHDRTSCICGKSFLPFACLKMYCLLCFSAYVGFSVGPVWLLVFGCGLLVPLLFSLMY